MLSPEEIIRRYQINTGMPYPDPASKDTLLDSPVRFVDTPHVDPGAVIFGDFSYYKDDQKIGGDPT